MDRKKTCHGYNFSICKTNLKKQGKSLSAYQRKNPPIELFNS